MDEVYVVLDDDGESVKVTGVFSSRELAEAMKAITPFSQVVDAGLLDEYAGMARAGVPLWRVEEMRGCLHPSRECPAREGWSTSWGVREFSETYSGEFHSGLVVRLWAKDEAEAIAKATEMFRVHREANSAN